MKPKPSYNLNTTGTLQQFKTWNETYIYPATSPYHIAKIEIYIHYRLSSGKMIFDLKHRCPHCRLLQDTTIDHDYFLTCINSRYKQAQRIESLIKILHRLRTLPPLRNLIIHHVDNHYNNDLHPDLPTTTTNPIFAECIIK